MRICFVTDGEVGCYEGNTEADLVLYPFSSLGEVSFERELKGETALFEDVALASKANKNTVICGCYTDARGIRRKSAVIADKGRILGVSDMVNHIDGSDYRPGAGIKIFDCSAGRVGIVVAEDVYFPQVLETLSLCGAELAVCLFETLNDALEPTLVRAGAFFFGLPVCLCAEGYALVANAAGKLLFSSPERLSRYELKKEQEYHVVETRRRLLLRSKRQ